MSGDQGRAHLYKGAGAVILLLVALIIFFKGQPDEPFQSILEWSTANHSASAITNGIDRLAVMEDFNQLDTHITDRCFAPVKLDPRQFQSERQYKLVSQFMTDMNQYNSAEKVTAFIDAAKQVIGANQTTMTSGETEEEMQRRIQEDIDHFSTFAGSRSILESNGDQEVLGATFQIASMRLQQLKSHEHIKLLTQMVDQGLLGELERSGVEITRAQKIKVKTQDVLRYWELTSTRYVLCHSGNRATTEFIQNQFPSSSKYRPVYINAINAVLDPAQRRFDTATILDIATDLNGTRLKLRESEKGSLALMTYKGALPRAKLYTDWISEKNPKTAHTIAFSTGFIPQTQVILQTDSISKPQQPALTVKLDPVRIVGMSRNHIELAVPPLEHNAVLLINNDYDQNWKASNSSQKVDLIKANLNACAIYLEPMNKNRLISLQRP